MVNNMSSVIDSVGSASPTLRSAARRVTELEPQQKAAFQPSRLGMTASKKNRWSSGRDVCKAKLDWVGS